MTSTSLPQAAASIVTMSIFERYLTLWLLPRVSPPLNGLA